MDKEFRRRIKHLGDKIDRTEFPQDAGKRDPIWAVGFVRKRGGGTGPCAGTHIVEIDDAEGRAIDAPFGRPGHTVFAGFQILHDHEDAEPTLYTGNLHKNDDY